MAKLHVGFRYVSVLRMREEHILEFPSAAIAACGRQDADLEI